MRLRVRGDNNGQVANTIINIGRQLSEPELQSRFYRDTGIKCCKDAREFYLRLLDDGKFSVDELRAAIRQKSVRWEFGATQPTIVMPWTDPALAWLIFGLMGLYTLLMIFGIFSGRPEISGPATAGAFMFACLCALVMYGAERVILHPRRVAIRVREWMEREARLQ